MTEKSQNILEKKNKFEEITLPDLLHPWDSPGKNTGVGCHFLLQCMNVKSQSEVTQSCPTLSDPTDCFLLNTGHQTHD